jgi:MFS family permease
MFIWFLPTIFFGPIAGVLADRYDRRLIMLLADEWTAWQRSSSA